MTDKEKEKANTPDGKPPRPPPPPADAPKAPEAGQAAKAESTGARAAPEASRQNTAGGKSESTEQPPESTEQPPESTGQRPESTEQPPESTAPKPEDPLETEAGGAAGEPPSEPDPEQLIAAARQEAEDNKDKFLRATAEMENYKRRINKEHADTMRYAMSPLIRDIAATVDTLELAVSHAKNDPDNGGQALVDGIEMVVKQIHEVFARFGVTRIETAGKPFDPELHEAMTVVETADVPENQVMEEFQAGFKLHERVIRPARVSVSKPPAVN